jgi:hypothetical protein
VKPRGDDGEKSLHTALDLRCVVLAVFFFLAVLLDRRRLLAASAIGASAHLVLVADPAREPEFGTRQIRALARVAAEMAGRRT